MPKRKIKEIPKIMIKANSNRMLFSEPKVQSILIRAGRQVTNKRYEVRWKERDKNQILVCRTILQHCKDFTGLSIAWAELVRSRQRTKANKQKPVIFKCQEKQKVVYKRNYHSAQCSSAFNSQNHINDKSWLNNKCGRTWEGEQG